jgi:enoyl-CoA hydratase
MTFSNLLVSRDDRVATITVNRPDKRNALDAATIDELRQALLAVRSDDDVRAVIVTGPGRRRSSRAPTSPASPAVAR